MEDATDGKQANANLNANLNANVSKDVAVQEINSDTKDVECTYQTPMEVEEHN